MQDHGDEVRFVSHLRSCDMTISDHGKDSGESIVDSRAETAERPSLRSVDYTGVSDLYCAMLPFRVLTY